MVCCGAGNEEKQRLKLDGSDIVREHRKSDLPSSLEAVFLVAVCHE